MFCVCVAHSNGAETGTWLMEPLFYGNSLRICVRYYDKSCVKIPKIGVFFNLKFFLILKLLYFKFFRTT